MDYKNKLTEITCDKCGAPYSSRQKFCASCGSMLDGNTNIFTPKDSDCNQSGIRTRHINEQNHENSDQQDSDSHPQAAQDTDLMTFLGSNQSVYIEKFTKMRATFSMVSWNWCSFFFGSLWFAYRKMYVIAVASTVLSLIFASLSTLGILLDLALWICSGLFGNYIYMQYVDSKILIAKNLDPNYKTVYIAKKGGTSSEVVIILIGIIFILFLIQLVITQNYLY